MTISGTACHVSLKGNLSGTYLSIWGSRAKDNEKITLGNQTWVSWEVPELNGRFIAGKIIEPNGGFSIATLMTGGCRKGPPKISVKVLLGL